MRIEKGGRDDTRAMLLAVALVCTATPALAKPTRSRTSPAGRWNAAPSRPSSGACRRSIST